MKKELLYCSFRHWLDKGTIYLYSDPHFSDRENYTFRFPKLFENISEDEVKTTMEFLDNMQITRINEKVGKCDTLIILGDVGNIDCISKLHGYKVLIMGNHDVGQTKYERKKLLDLNQLTGRFHVVEDNKLFDEVYPGKLTISQKIVLSHEPVNDEFSFNLHGHVHNSFEDTDGHFNFCAEKINYTPVKLDDLVKQGLFKNVEDIHRETIDKATIRKLNRD